MAEDLDPVTGQTHEISHRGILIIMAVVVLGGSLLGLVLAGGRFAGGVLFGGALAYGNYLWLDRSTKAIFRPDAVRSSGLLAAKYILRYAVLGAVLLLVYLTEAFPMPAVIAGLAAFAIAVLVHGLKNIVTS